MASTAADTASSPSSPNPFDQPPPQLLQSRSSSPRRRPDRPRHTTMTAATTAAVRLPPCASLYASTSTQSGSRPSSVGGAAKSEDDATAFAQFALAASPAATGSASPASLAQYALAPATSAAPRLGEARTTAIKTTFSGEPSHPSLSVPRAVVAPPPALAQPDVHARAAAAASAAAVAAIPSPRARQRSPSPASQLSVAEPTAKPPRSFDNLLATPQHGSVNASQWTSPWTLYTAGPAAATHTPPTHQVASSTAPSSPGRSSISGLSALSAPDPGAPSEVSPPYTGSTPAFPPYPPTPCEPAPAPLYGGPPVAPSHQLGDSLFSTSAEPKPAIGRAVSASLSQPEDVADDSGAASGSQGEGYPCQDKVGGKPRKELKGSSEQPVPLASYVSDTTHHVGILTALLDIAERAEQNRAAQRAFRERKEQKLR